MKLDKTDYKDFIRDIKSKIQTSQIKAHIKVNTELLKLYRKSLIYECVTGKKQVWNGEIENEGWL